MNKEGPITAAEARVRNGGHKGRGNNVRGEVRHRHQFQFTPAAVKLNKLNRTLAKQREQPAENPWDDFPPGGMHASPGFRAAMQQQPATQGSPA